VIFKSHEILLELSNHGVCLAVTWTVAGMGGLGGGEYILSPSNLLNGEHELHLGNTTYGGHRRCTWRSTNNIKKKFMVSHSLHAYKMVKVK